MACLEHECTNDKCDWTAMDNVDRRDESCPECGAPLLTFFDEEGDHPSR